MTVTLPRIVIIGASGFIGRQLSQFLIELSFPVTLLCRSAVKLAGTAQNAVWIRGDATSPTDLKRVLNDCDVVINCAGSVRGRTREDFEAANVEIPRKLAQVILKLGSGIRLIHLSSLASREPRLSHYADSKRQGESVLMKSVLKDYIIIRPPAVYGPGDKELQCLFDAMRHGVLFVPGGNPDRRFSLIHCHDLCAFIAHLIHHWPLNTRLLEPDDHNPNGYSWTELREIAGQVLQRRIYTLPIPVFMLTGIAAVNMLFSRLLHYAPMLTNGKVRELMHDDWVCRDNNQSCPGWKPGISLSEGLAALYNIHVS